MELIDTLSRYRRNIQLNLIPWLEQELGEFTEKEEHLILLRHMTLIFKNSFAMFRT